MPWTRPTLAVALASGVALTLGVIPASATESDLSSCVADGYRAQAKVNYRRTPAETYIDSISVNVDKRAGAHNTVRIVVKDEDRTVFYYASGNDVTAGPFLFDYTDNPIPTHQADESDRMRVDVTFDFDTTGGNGSSSGALDGAPASAEAPTRCTATVRY